MRVRLTLAGSTVLCVLVSVLVWGGPSAGAAATHHYLSQITEVPASSGASVPGPLEAMESMTLDSGHLWIAEKFGGRSRVDEFDASTGAFLAQPVHAEGPVSYGEPGIAVGHATGEGELYVGETVGGEPAVAVFSEAGAPQATWTGLDTPAGSFGSLVGDVAVDNSASLSDWAAGDVYVAVPGQGAIDVFHPEAGGKEKYVTRLAGVSPSEHFQFPFKMAVNQANGDLVVLDVATSTVDVFEPTVLGEYAFVRKIAGPSGGALNQIYNLAVDGASGEIYVTEGFKPTVIDQFSATGAYLGRIVGVDSPGGNIDDVFSLTVDPSSHEVYVADNRSVGSKAVKIFGADVVIPDVKTTPISNATPASVSLNGTVNPDNAGAATCQFEWGTSTAFGQVAPCSAPIADGESPVAVHADLSGLQADTTYHYRLQASNANGTNPGEAFEDQEFTTPGPGMHGESVLNIASTSATLEATINPHHAPTTYYFQYGTSSSYGTSVPVPGAPLGSTEGDLEVAQHLQKLAAATTYHYRVVVISELNHGEFEEFDGEDRLFTTQASHSEFSLLDGRGWEMVSPPNKLGASLLPIGGEGRVIQAASDGSAISYVATAPIELEPPGDRSPENVQVLSKLASDGWVTRVIATPHDATHKGTTVGHPSEYKAFSADLSVGLVEAQGTMPLSAEASEWTPYLRHDETCETSPTTCYQPLVTAGNVVPGTKFGGDPTSTYGAVEFVGATPDFGHIILDSRVALTPGGSAGLYEWSDGELTFVENMQLGRQNRRVLHAVSNDGSRVIGDRASEQGLFMRDVTKRTTIRLDIAEPGAAGGYGEPNFQTASDDDSRVFFTDTAQLTLDSAASFEPRKPDLYEFNLVTGRVTDLSVPLNHGEQAGLIGMVDASKDGSYVYFVANGVLAAGAIPGSCQYGSSNGTGMCNLYVSHNGVTTFIATLSGEDGQVFEGNTARVSPNGRWLTFMSERSLTGYDNRDADSGKPDEEVFLYDANPEASASHLRCISCDPTGARPVGAFIPNIIIQNNEVTPLVNDSRIWGTRWLAATIPGQTDKEGGGYDSRDLSDEGRLFFNSNDALTPQDTNGTWDVYEYEPATVGDCKSADGRFVEGLGGCVSLVSSGGARSESVFLDASESGDDAFFLTGAGLVNQDYDGALDIYDAHVCSASSPCLPTSTVLPPPCSTGDSCKPAPSPQPEIFGAPSSETFSGTGNVTAGGGALKTAPRSLTRAQKLARALKVCRKRRPEHKRVLCKRQVKKRYAKKAVVKSKVGKSVSGRTGR